MSNDYIARVQYFPQQFLRTEDFNAEQAYHLEIRRRHNIGHHSWGVVYGLQTVAEEEGLFVQPGMAVDGFGRELILPERLPVPLSEFDAQDTDRLDVWLLYNRRSSDQAPAGYGRCSPETQTAFYRWQELPALRLERPNPNYPDPRRPKAVVEAGVESVPHQRPPDDPARQWPVFLGRVLRDRSDPEQPVYSVDQLGRPVAGLVGDAVVSPSRRAVAFVGDTRRVDASGQVPVVQQTGRFSVALRHEQEELKEYLRIQGPGEVDLYGRTRLHGDMTLSSGAIRFESTGSVAELPLCSDIGRQGDAQLQRFDSAAGQGSPCDPSVDQGAVHETPHSWRIYRHRCRTSGTESEAEVRDQLRIEMGAKAVGAANEVVIGAWSPDEETFKPILTVSNTGVNAGQVTVHGNLVVKGDITKDVAATAARLSPQARDFFLGTFSSGVGGANLQLEKFYRSPFGDEFNVCDDRVQTAIVNDLVVDADCLNRFVEKLTANAAVRTMVAEKMVALDSGRKAILNAMRPKVDVNEPLNQFAALLEQRTYADRPPAFAGALARTEAGQRATIEAMLPGSSELTAFATLAREQYPTWLSGLLGEVQDTPAGAETVAEAMLSRNEGRTAVGINLATSTGRISSTLAPIMAEEAARAELAEALLVDPGGQVSVGGNLVDHNDRLSPTLAPVMAEETARGELAEVILVDHAGQAAIGDNLILDTAVPPQYERWAGVVAPALADASLPDSRNELAAQILVANNGRVAVADQLQGNGPARSDFVSLIQGDAYATLKGDICATCL